MPATEFGKRVNDMKREEEFQSRSRRTKGQKIYEVYNIAVIVLLSVCCLVPILNLLAYSFSSSTAIVGNKVGIFPVDFTLEAYDYVLHNEAFWISARVTILRVLIGVPLNILMCILVAYPLSKPESQFPPRKYYVALMLTTMLFSGGMMPTYFVVSKTGLIDTIWSLILPGAVATYNCMLMMNFFRGIPSALEESAKLDGANQWIIMSRIYLPLSKPSIATIALFALVGHWNAWFDGLIYSNHTYNYPLQSYLQTLVTLSTEDLANGDLDLMLRFANTNNTNMKSAQIFISIIPLMFIYPFLQKYFTKGLTVGSVKG